MRQLAPVLVPVYFIKHGVSCYIYYIDLDTALLQLNYHSSKIVTILQTLSSLLWTEGEPSYLQCLFEKVLLPSNSECLLPFSL